MKALKKLGLYTGRLLIACVFAICMVIGVVPIVPKRKEQFEIEVKLEETSTELTSNSVNYQDKK
jgi:hypothetical protein